MEELKEFVELKHSYYEANGYRLFYLKFSGGGITIKINQW